MFFFSEKKGKGLRHNWNKNEWVRANLWHLLSNNTYILKQSTWLFHTLKMILLSETKANQRNKPARLLKETMKNKKG